MKLRKYVALLLPRFASQLFCLAAKTFCPRFRPWNCLCGVCLYLLVATTAITTTIITTTTTTTQKAT